MKHSNNWTDAAGNTHAVVIDLDAATRLRDEVELDLLVCLTEPAKLEQIYQRLHDDPRLVVSALAVIEDTPEPETFGRRFNGDALEDGMLALLRGMADFFPSRQRQILLRLLARCEEAAEILTSRAASQAIAVLDSEAFLSAALSIATPGNGSSESVPSSVPTMTPAG